jgi:hypothetical protein
MPSPFDLIPPRPNHFRNPAQRSRIKPNALRHNDIW